MTRELTVPELSLVVLIGVTGSGKSTFGRTHFRPTEVISSDFCRGLVADDENDQSATPEAFELLHYIVGLRLKAGRLTVVDATNVQPDDRRSLVAIAREHDVLAVGRLAVLGTNPVHQLLHVAGPDPGLGHQRHRHVGDASEMVEVVHHVVADAVVERWRRCLRPNRPRRHSKSSSPSRRFCRPGCAIFAPSRRSRRGAIGRGCWSWPL